MIQNSAALDDFHSSEDPWGYGDNKEDLKRKEILLSELPDREYKNVLDIGCGQGFVTQDLPGMKITGVDISQAAVDFANKNLNRENLIYKQGSIFKDRKSVV